MNNHDPAQFPLLAGLEPAAREKAAASLIWQHHDAGQTILGQNDLSGDVHFLAQGRLLAVYWTEDGREIIFSAIPKGGYFGELTALDPGPRSLCVYARTAAELATMPAKTFRSLIDDSPGFRNTILTDLVARIRILTERNCQLIAFSVPDRVKAFILRRAAEENRLTANARLTAFPTHAEIAAQIGANREAVSRALSALAQSGIIATRRGSLTILDPDGLLITADDQSFR